MNESAKTIAFVAVAVGASLIAWITRPRLEIMTSEDMRGQVLFSDFEDPLEATSLEIVEFDEETATVRPFKVAQVKDQWSIPSHDDYPADAENQLAELAAGMIGLKVLDMASDSLGDHPLYGVVDPDPKRLKAGDTGVGTRVEMRNKSDNLLLAMIVGKEVPDRDGLRYVREVGKDQVYTVALKSDKLSTKFEDWIEDDLLKLNTWDVKQVKVNDYSVDILAGRRAPRSLMTLDYDDGDSKWKLTEDKVFKDADFVDMEMAENEELDTSKLNDMKWALDDLKIVDVARKPEGLSENLRDTGQVAADSEAYQSLMSRGFYIIPVGDHYELLSSEGEIIILMKDGVEYVLRFGQITGTASQGSSDEDEEKKEGEEEEAGDEKEKESEGGGLNRYLFVMAQFNEDALAKPELEELPEEQEASGEAEAAEGDAPKAEASGGEAAEEGTPEEKASDDESSKEGETEAAKEDQKAEVEKERERIEKENKRKREEYDEKVKKGRDRVKELNDRFADWYYVISDEVYQKIHLGRDDVIKKKEKGEDEEKKEGEETEQSEADASGMQEAPKDAAEQAKEEGTGVTDFEELKKEGLDKKEE